MTHLVYGAGPRVGVDDRGNPLVVIAYVGRTSRSLAERIEEHERDRTGPFKRYAEVEWVVLAVCETLKECKRRELAAIDALRPECNGRVEPMTAWRRLRGVCASWWRRSVRMARRGLELIGGVVVVTSGLWWWLG